MDVGRFSPDRTMTSTAARSAGLSATIFRLIIFQKEEIKLIPPDPRLISSS